MLFLVNDSIPQARAQALKILSHCLQLVRSVPCSDANIFPEYVLPIMAHSRSGDCICQEYCITGRDGFEISGNGSARLNANQENNEDDDLSIQNQVILVFSEELVVGEFCLSMLTLKGKH